MRRNDISSPEFRLKFESMLDKGGPLHPHQPRLGPCWNWLGCRNADDYGNLTIGLKCQSSHRVAWLLWRSPLTTEHVLHSCDNRACANPDHLFLGTHRDNMRDCSVKGRFAERHTNSAWAIAKRERAAAVRQAYAGGATQVDLAEKFSMSQQMISRIVRGDSWAT